MSKVKLLKPEHGVVYECYKGYVDEDGDRARKGQLFIFDGDITYNNHYIFAKASGRGIDIYVDYSDFESHFCPQYTERDVEEKLPTKQTPDVKIDIELVEGTWAQVKEHFAELPSALQEILKMQLPALFDTPQAFEFDEEKNIFSTRNTDTLPFFVGRGLVEKEDKMKCIVVQHNYTAELFECDGYQCIRFVRK
jgi:hypothetical protein